jgi:GNAT superfamily N-acetyltransferase
MIRPCTDADLTRIFQIINQAATAYRGVIPGDCYHEPYMPLDELQAESQEMTFFGWEEPGELVGIMGYQPIAPARRTGRRPLAVTLIRHAYVLPDSQRRGVGSALLQHLVGLAMTPRPELVEGPRLLVGTWAAASWAIAFYEKHGFRLLPDGDLLLRTYWHIPDRQRETSVVLGTELNDRPTDGRTN